MDWSHRVSKSYRSMQLRWTRAKYHAKWWLEELPQVERPVMAMWRIGRLVLYTCRWRLAALVGTLSGAYVRAIDVDRTCWVAPNRIEYVSRKFKARDFRGRVVDGDWDRLEKRFEDLEEHVALKQVCTEGKAWPETAFYRRRLDSLARGEILYYAKDAEGLEQWCRGRESLFETIRREGYRSQREILLSRHVNDPVLASDEVTVSIGRHGDLLFSKMGTHRLAIAKLLGVELIPVRVAARHPEWVRFREDLLLYARANGGQLPQPIRHPDLDDIPASHECEETFRLIWDNMSARQGRLLDIGAKWGYFCHRLEDEGFDCHAVEESLVDRYFLEKLRRAENKRFKTIATSVPDCVEAWDARFDVVLALNVLHRYLGSRESYARLVNVLNRLQTTELFFEPHLTTKPEMEGAYRSFAADEFVEFLLGNTSLETAETIRVVPGARRLYRLY